MSKYDGFIHNKNGYKECKNTTQGWQVLVECRDKTTTWTDLKYVKEASSIELAEYAATNKIDDELEFDLWVTYTLK